MVISRYILNKGFRKLKLCHAFIKGFSTGGNFESCLISCEQLSKVMEDPVWFKHYRLLDATWDLDVKNYEEIHFSNRIPCSKFFDLEVCRDSDSEYKMMLPSCEQFEEYVSERGISNDHHVVIYDNHMKHAIFSSPRLWWMFRVFGHRNVSVLNGGLKSWIKGGYDTISGDYIKDEMLPQPPTKFKTNFTPSLVKDFNFIKDNATKPSPVPILESRGLATLPLKDGETDLSDVSVPCAKWTPFGALLDEQKRSVRSSKEINDFFSSNNINLDKEVVTSCGRGVSASIVSLCIFYATGKEVPVYDGSWSEWKSRNSIP